MSTGIVVLNYNDYESTISLVVKIKEYKSIDHIVVVDNHSVNDSLKKLSGLKDNKTDVIGTKKNLGYAGGNNIGMKYLIKKYNVDILGISNPDAEFTDEFVEKINTDFLEFPEYSLLTGKQITDAGEIVPNAFWEDYKYTDCLKIVFDNFYLRQKFLSHKANRETFAEKAVKNASGIITVPVVSGCLFFVRASDIKKVDFFDKHTFLYFEESILSKKLQAAGMISGVDTDIEFRHKGSVTIDKKYDNAGKQKMLFDSMSYFVKRYVTDSFFKGLIFDFMVSLYWIEFYSGRYILKIFRPLSNLLKRKRS